MKLRVPDTLTNQEVDFCELYIFGNEPFLGNAEKCYVSVFDYEESDGKNTARKMANQLLNRNDIQDYLTQLRETMQFEAADLKMRLTDKLLKIIDETSTATYKDRRGTELSPAALRSVAVQATKAVMEMYPLRVAQESKVELSGKDQSGIVFNVILPGQKEDQGE